MNLEYLTTPISFVSAITANPLMTVIYSCTHTLYLLQPKNDEEEFALLMAGAILYRGDPSKMIDVNAIVEAMASWKQETPEVFIAVQEANRERKKAGVPLIKQR